MISSTHQKQKLDIDMQQLLNRGNYSNQIKSFKPTKTFMTIVSANCGRDYWLSHYDYDNAVLSDIHYIFMRQHTNIKYSSIQF